jgi:isopropylmalate/homocitrate/citramalate synthase
LHETDGSYTILVASLSVEILDTTLREGELFRVLPVSSRVKVATLLAEAGVRRVELTVDYPPRTTYEQTVPVVSALKDRGVEVVMHGRATDEDLAAISKYDISGCGLYIAVTKLHREFKLHGISEEEAIGRLEGSVEKARSMGFRYIRATMEDASRLFVEEGEASVHRLVPSIRSLSNAGATLLSIPDTSGLMTPRQARSFFRSAKSAFEIPVSAHFHNDYGFASANTVEAGLEGADEIQVTLLGIGDRNGIADLYEVVAALEDVYQVRTGLNRRALKNLYTVFAKVAELQVPWRHPLSESAQTVRAGVHQSMTVRRKDGYIPAQKLLNDFGEPLYAISPYVSHNLVQTILAPYAQLNPDSSRRVAEALALQSGRGRPSVRTVRDVIMSETGVSIPEKELGRYFGSEKMYILLKLRPQFAASALLDTLTEMDEVDSVDEVYGDVDVVVRAHTPPGKDSVVSVLRQRFSDQIQDMKVLVTD